ncbi:hypothetical protein B4U37_02640 [Sutcliffiella horikoshii]|uniref:Transposase n=1 Tax=Sutcliffiella horikoshii TaxID=79883 RepID=A0ABN4Z9S4_9BACI|nr:hypothetical protein B4U37_02640 [Sutcliffiella horikoshii]
MLAKEEKATIELVAFRIRTSKIAGCAAVGGSDGYQEILRYIKKFRVDIKKFRNLSRKIRWISRNPTIYQ